VTIDDITSTERVSGDNDDETVGGQGTAVDGTRWSEMEAGRTWTWNEERGDSDGE